MYPFVLIGMFPELLRNVTRNKKVKIKMGLNKDVDMFMFFGNVVCYLYKQAIRT